MDIMQMALSELKKPEKNIRLHTDKQLKEFARSIKMFGQIRPIVVDENNVILAGNGLYDTMKGMGIETADVVKYTNLTENQKKKLMIADNKIFNLGVDDLDTLNSFIEELKDDLDIPGFDEDILLQMVSDAEEITERITEFGVLDPQEIQEIQGRKSDDLIHGKSESKEMPDNMQRETIRTRDEEGASAELQKFLICPNCGEKIWL